MGPTDIDLGFSLGLERPSLCGILKDVDGKKGRFNVKGVFLRTTGSKWCSLREESVFLWSSAAERRRVYVHSAIGMGG